MYYDDRDDVDDTISICTTSSSSVRIFHVYLVHDDDDDVELLFEMGLSTTTTEAADTATIFLCYDIRIT